MGFHFFVPFFVLLSRHVKRHKNKLIWVAGWMLIARYADLYWQIVPAFKEDFHFHWLYIVPLIGLGGVWLFVFFWQLQERSLLPLPDDAYESAEAATLNQAQGAFPGVCTRPNLGRVNITVRVVMKKTRVSWRRS